ncbi:MAG: oligoendopeptidase F [Chloroflexota bacterium]
MNTTTLPARNELAPDYTWNLESIYHDNEAWEKEFEAVSERLPGLQAYQGKVGESAHALLSCFKYRDEVEVVLERVIVYAHMRRDEDNSNPLYQALYERAISLATEFSAVASFIVPEIVAISDECLEAFLQEEPALAVYRQHLAQIVHEKAHIRSAEVEEILAQAYEATSGASNAYQMLNNADLTFPKIRDENGDEVELTKGRYTQFLESPNREVRKAAFEALYSSYASYKNTFGATYAAAVKRDIFYARVRHYPNALAASLSSDNIPVEVYDQLIETVNHNLPTLHRYISLRKRLLGLDELHAYDLYVPLISDVQRKVPYEEAIQTILEAFAPLGEDYVAVVKEGIKSRWVDVYENRGKSSGAYSNGAYTTQPFILMNYQNTLDSVFTLAHEMGHSLHSYYTNLTQPYVYANYSLFVAEVASTANEALVTHYLLQRTEDKKLRSYLINNELEKFRGTLFRQTMFAEFEREAHRMAEAGEALTPDSLSNMYRGLNERYFGPEVVIDPQVELEWMRIPHFYRAFYVYQYATGISAATALSQQILKEGAPAVERYRAFLASGSSDYPTNLLKKAGVDITTPVPVQQAFDTFAEMLKELEELA